MTKSSVSAIFLSLLFTCPLSAGDQAQGLALNAPSTSISFSPAPVDARPAIVAAPTNGEADDMFTLDDPIQPFHCRLDGSTNLVARVVLTKTKKYPIAPITLGRTSIRKDGRLTPLLTVEGTVDASQLTGNDAVVQVEIADVLASPELAGKFYAALEEEEALKGRTWAQPRIKAAVNVALKWADPENGNQQRTLARCQLNRKDGQVRHKLNFRIDNASDLAALRSAQREELSIELNVDAYCRSSENIAIAQSSVIASSAISTANELLSKAGSDCALFMATGGGLNSRAAMQSMLKRRIETEIAVRRGESVPTETLNAILDHLLGSSLRTVELQSVDQQQRVGMVIGNQLLVTAPLGQLQGALSSIRKMAETNDLHDLMTGQKKAISGGASFMGIGASASVANEEQRREMTNKLRRDLDEASQNFTGALPTVTAMDAKHLNGMAATDSTALQLILSRFSVGWKPLITETSLETTHQRAEQLQTSIAQRDAIVAAIALEVAKFQESAMVETTKATEAGVQVAIISGLEKARLNNSLEVKRYESFLEWTRYLQACGHGDVASDLYSEHMRNSEGGKPNRHVYLDERRQQVAEAEDLLAKDFASLTALVTDLKVRNDNRTTSSANLRRQLLHLQDLNTEIETMHRLGVK